LETLIAQQAQNGSRQEKLFFHKHVLEFNFATINGLVFYFDKIPAQPLNKYWEWGRGGEKEELESKNTYLMKKKMKYFLSTLLKPFFIYIYLQH
jgi:hypothetical protein